MPKLPQSSPKPSQKLKMVLHKLGLKDIDMCFGQGCMERFTTKLDKLKEASKERHIYSR